MIDAVAVLHVSFLLVTYSIRKFKPVDLFVYFTCYILYKAIQLDGSPVIAAAFGILPVVVLTPSIIDRTDKKAQPCGENTMRRFIKAVEDMHFQDAVNRPLPATAVRVRSG